MVQEAQHSVQLLQGNQAAQHSDQLLQENQVVQHLSDEVDLAAVLGKGIDNVPDVERAIGWEARHSTSILRLGSRTKVARGQSLRLRPESKVARRSLMKPSWLARAWCRRCRCSA